MSLCLPSFLTTSRTPVYGLIFLFRYGESNTAEEGGQCPKHVWFANQISDNSCATVALLNMCNNLPRVHLGPELRKFKSETMDLSPVTRGIHVSEFAHV